MELSEEYKVGLQDMVVVVNILQQAKTREWGMNTTQGDATVSSLCFIEWPNGLAWKEIPSSLKRQGKALQGVLSRQISRNRVKYPLIPRRIRSSLTFNWQLQQVIDERHDVIIESECTGQPPINLFCVLSIRPYQVADRTERGRKRAHLLGGGNYVLKLEF